MRSSSIAHKSCPSCTKAAERSCGERLRPMVITGFS
jgi:hypothetical protein